MGYSLRQKLGAIAIDWPCYEWGLRTSWQRIRNRDERLLTSPDGRGVSCQWKWTSDLHAAKVFPSLGTRLMRRALLQWPIGFAETPNRTADPIQVSFVIGHRGMQRVPLLLATLATVAAQQGVHCECIVIEQAESSEVRDVLPPWVRHVHTPVPVAGMPYCRAWSLNVGAKLALGRLLVFQDNDILLPQGYAAECWRRYREGYEIINLKRFIFYLSEAHSAQVESLRAIRLTDPPESIMQNAEAGGSLAVDRRTFLAIGGYDEGFVGWGGEDNEFWERAKTCRVWPYGYLPFVHLWHPAQSGKADPANPNSRRYEELVAIKPQQRIAELRERCFGQVDRLSVEWKDR